MESVKIKKIDQNIVSCLMENPEHPKGIVIAIHGFSSNKECATFQMLFRRLPAAGYGVLGIDLPGHGSEESLQETLRIEGCKNSIEAAEHFAADRFPGLPIFYFASSFGAYLTGLYVSTRPHLGRKAFFRSAAVNMPELFVGPNPPERHRQILEALEKQGYFDANIETSKPVRITKEMYRDFKMNDLFQIFDPTAFGGTAVRMAHGSEDAVIDPRAAEKFAAQFHVPLTVFENEGHSLSGRPDTADRVADLAIAFYNEDT